MTRQSTPLYSRHSTRILFNNESHRFENEDDYRVTIYVKRVYTNRIACYEMSKYMTMNEMIQQLARDIPRDFELYEYELVESRYQETGHPIEFTSNSNTTLEIHYPNQMDISFYVRPGRQETITQNHVPREIIRQNIRIPPLNLDNIFRNETSTTFVYNVRVNPRNTEINQCPICQETISVQTYYQCSHKFCNHCIEGCINANIQTCAICRKPL
jgi:hypothetical protein